MAPLTSDGVPPEHRRPVLVERVSDRLHRVTVAEQTLRVRWPSELFKRLEAGCQIPDSLAGKPTDRRLEQAAIPFDEIGSPAYPGANGEVDVITGSASNGVGAAGGGAGSVVVLDKTTEAFVDENATVVALAQGPAIDAPTGEFIVSSAAEDAIKSLLGPAGFSLLQSAANFIVNNPISELIVDLLEGVYHLFITPVDLPILDLSLINERHVRPRFVPAAPVKAPRA